ncbi:TPA: Mu transposase C-terminal domain-containing protein [Mannheimia haemolytica]|uniref:Bacteriophage Mu transposase n=1 Tax=Mannheimia haemolytica TaxID=75985 RepID=A0A378NH82_MANHA|nr:transposase domain-containing protein [Mannheimia haemolytica]AGQ26411.1 transposase [Mannheimia haemolytica D153]AWW64837.1 transposase [Mannheimia haemolytica]KYL17178.1 transposase [Mannheimia haemolytica]MDW0362163.1 transposase domain-containing protein [Mannheimia haemolytica]MDW0370278.1 transposase domain-containing protein [Mannheimia haemolytica]
MKEWFLAKEIAGLSGVPELPNSVSRLATKEGWQKRQIQGVRGVTYEYHLTSLPIETQQQLRLNAALAVIPQAAELQPKRDDPALIARLNNATDKGRDKAKGKAEACMQLQAFLDQGFSYTQAEAGAATAKNVSQGSLKNWYYKVKGHPVHLWQAILISESGRSKKPQLKAKITEEAWDCFLADYLRPEKPDLRASYRRTQAIAKQYGWQMASLQTFQRRVLAEVPYEVILLKREGANAVAKLVPALQRTVKDILAGEWINGDGYQHNVFVKWHTGEIVRPKTWFWQDVRTRKILGYRTSISENTDSIRHALMDVIFNVGIPKTLTLDNTRAAANKAMTGGIENRYRFKHTELDPKGIMPILGIDVHFTSILYGEGHGQAKPIERAFGRGGIGEKIDKRPELSGFYTGRNAQETPDNYNGGKDGVDYNTFLKAIAAGIEEYNSQTERHTEMCRGELSFNQVWERDYHPSNVRQASPEQLRLLFLQAETVSIKRNGSFTLKAAGKLYGLTNVYWAESLIGITDKKVVARFDPDDLHGNVYVYNLEGQFLAEAVCREAKGFGDTSASREQGRLYQKVVKSAKAQAEALELLEAHELASLAPQVDVPEPIEKKVKEVLVKEDFIVDFNTVRKATVVEETEEISIFDEVLLKQEKQLRIVE